MTKQSVTNLLDDVLEAYLGAPCERLNVTATDQFFIVCDVRLLCRAVGGKWTKMVDAVEHAERERLANFKAGVTRDELNEKWIAPKKADPT